VAVGLGDFDLGGLTTGQVPDRLSSVSFVPGIELDWAVGERWLLRPYFNMGYSAQIGGDAVAWTHYFGVSSIYTLYSKEVDLRLLNALQWFGYNSNVTGINRFSRAVAGIEGDLPLTGWEVLERPLMLMPHLVYYWYMNDFDVRSFTSNSASIEQEVEIAMAVGSKEKFSIWFFTFDRVGVGYRVGNDLEGIRFFTTAVFD
jgi:hypothetical protein